jgi:hypothetical protein
VGRPVRAALAGRVRHRRREVGELTARSLVGLVLLNLFLLGSGAGLLWGLRGWRSWAELGRLLGFAYLLGVAAMGIVFVLELVVGISLTVWTVLVTGIVLSGAGVGAGFALGRPRPVRREPTRGGFPVATTIFAAAIAVYFAALFRSGRLAGLYEWDAFSFWVPKAKAIYFFGGLDERFFRELPAQTYPPLLPALEAAAFRFMGSADVVTLHLQFWFLFVGFVGAAAGLLAARVPPLVLWPPLLLVLVAPRIVGNSLAPEADFLLHYFFAAAALLVGLWLLERQPWQLVTGSVFLAAAMLTKREGYLLALCVFGAALLASLLGTRREWPRVLIAGAAAFAVVLPWRIWFGAKHLSGEGPESGAGGLLSNADRAWPSFKLVLSAIFDVHQWLLGPPLVVVALVLAFVAGARRLSAYVASVLALGIAAFTWVIWAFPSLPLTKAGNLNPVVRVSGALVFLAAVLLPLLLDAAWRGTGRREGA